GSEPRDDPQQRRLATARGTDQRRELTRAHAERDLPECLHRAAGGGVDHAHAIQRDEVAHRELGPRTRAQRIDLGSSILVRNSLVNTSLQSTCLGTPMYVLTTSTDAHIFLSSIQPMPFLAYRSVFISSSPMVMFGSMMLRSISGTRFLKISSADFGFSITSRQPM